MLVAAGIALIVVGANLLVTGAVSIATGSVVVSCIANIGLVLAVPAMFVGDEISVASAVVPLHPLDGGHRARNLER